MGLKRKLFSLTYDRFMRGTEQAGLDDIRAQLVANAAGEVLEVGAGTGHNLPHYGSAVTALTLTEPEPTMLRQLRRAAGTVSPAPTILRAPAEDLPFDDATFDTVVCTLVLCGVDDQPRAIREMRRVLRPDGQLLLVEHVRSGHEALARKQDRMNWINRLVAGCNCNRPTQETLRREGFTVDVTDSELPKSPPFARPMIVGTATRAADFPVPQT